MSKFKLLKVIDLKDLKDGKIKEIDSSDLAIQGQDFVAQFRYVEDEKPEMKKKTIRPGVWDLTSTMGGLMLYPFELKIANLLETVDNTKTVKERAKQFFENLDVYDELEQPKIRNFLLYSDPGFGKSSAINSLCDGFIKEDPGTVVINWNTSSVRSSQVSSFFSKESEFSEEVTRMILIIEDIGGGEQEYSGNRAVDSSLLNLLDGNSVNFRVPTLGLATTNYPANLLSALADRPGRFDEMVKLPAPTAEERVAIAEFVNKKPLSDEDKASLGDSKWDSLKLSIAHVKEIVIRSRLTGRAFGEILKEMKDHKDKINDGFSEKGRMGMGFN